MAHDFVQRIYTLNIDQHDATALLDYMEVKNVGLAIGRFITPAWCVQYPFSLPLSRIT